MDWNNSLLSSAPTRAVIMFISVRYCRQDRWGTERGSAGQVRRIGDKTSQRIRGAGSNQKTVEQAQFACSSVDDRAQFSPDHPRYDGDAIFSAFGVADQVPRLALLRQMPRPWRDVAVSRRYASNPAAKKQGANAIEILNNRQQWLSRIWTSWPL